MVFSNRTCCVSNFSVDISFQSPSKQQAFEQLNIPDLTIKLNKLETKILGIQQSLSNRDDLSSYERGLDFGFETVFTHNDLLSGNVMIPLNFFESTEEQKVTFIDYEYAGYNSRAFDLANHLPSP